MSIQQDISRVAKIASQVFKVSVKEIRSQSIKRDVAQARNSCYFALSENYTMGEVSRAWGKHDKLVSDSNIKLRKRCEGDPILAKKVAKVLELFSHRPRTLMMARRIYHRIPPEVTQAALIEAQKKNPEYTMEQRIEVRFKGDMYAVKVKPNYGRNGWEWVV